MDFPKNTFRISEDEVNAVLQSIARQIADPESNKTFGKDVVARVHGYSTYRDWSGRSDTTYFNKLAIWKALEVVKQNGWHCWSHTDYENTLSIWITCSATRPHPWYSQC